MDLSPFKHDIDELIDKFVEGQSTTLRDMKAVWLSMKFSHIYDASPSSNLAFFMQSLYAHTIGHIVNTDSLSRRLGGLYCLYCLYETQPFKPPYKIYVSLGELKKLKELVAEAKQNCIRVVPSLVKRMLEKNIFLFGFVDLNEGSVTETVNQLNELQNTRIKVAYEKLFANTQIEQYLHMDLGVEFDLNRLKKMSTEYAEAKKQAIEEAGKVVDVQNVNHIAYDKESLGNKVGKMTEDWNIKKDVLYQQTGLNQFPGRDGDQPQSNEQQNDYSDDDRDEILQLLYQDD